MTEAAIAPLERAQKLAGVAATFAVIAAIIIAIGAAAQVAAAGWAEAGREQEATPDWRGALALLRYLGTFAVLAIPSFLLVDALLGLSRVLDEFGKGQFFTLRASLGVRKAGESALWALAFKILISPTVFSWITHEGRGFVWNTEPFELGLIAFAAFVMVLGRVLEAAARIKEENDQIV
jgi:hypothetical protein